MTTTRATCTAPCHDTRSAYQRHGCRCPGAMEANRRHVAGQRIPGRGIHRGGWPGGQVDDAAVQLCVTGKKLVPLTQAELQAAMDQLDTGRLPAFVIAERLGVSERTVYRHRARRKRQASAQ